MAGAADSVPRRIRRAAAWSCVLLLGACGGGESLSENAAGVTAGGASAGATAAGTDAATVDPCALVTAEEATAALGAAAKGENPLP
jgi:hypothetical protein